MCACSSETGADDRAEGKQGSRPYHVGLHENAVMMTSPSHAFLPTDHVPSTYVCFVSNRFASSRLKFLYIKHLQHTSTCSYACPAPWRGPRWGGASPVPLEVQSLTHGDSPRLERGGRQRSPWSCRSHLPSQAPRKTQHHMGSITPTTRTHTSRQVPFGLGAVTKMWNRTA